MEGNARTFAFTTAKLLDYATDTDALEASHNPISWLTLVHLRTQQTHHDPAKRYAAKLHLIRLLFKHRWKPGRIIVLFNAINWMMTLPELYQRRYWRAIRRLEKGHEMELLNQLEQMFFDDGIKKGVERGLKQGRQEGLEEGLEQGGEQGRTEGAARLLERRTGGVTISEAGPWPLTVTCK